MINNSSKTFQRLLAVVLPFILCLTVVPATVGQTLYGGLGGHNNPDSTNDGALATVSQTTGAVTIVGHPAGVVRITGLAFNSTGTLYGSTLIPGGGFPPPSGPRTSQLITLNAFNGALLSSTPITIGMGGPLLSIADLAIQPSTNVLFGVTSPDGPNGGPGDLYTINPATGAASLIGNTGFFFNSIGFAANGTLFLASANLDFATGTDLDIGLRTLNPATAGVLTSVTTDNFFGALAVRPDGVIFGGTGDQHQLFTINPTTGAQTLIGDTGTTFVGDLAFQTPDTSTTFGLMVIGLVGLAGSRAFTRLRPAGK